VQTTHNGQETLVSEPFIAEIRMVPYNFAPRGWAFCNGALLPISQNTALFALIGTTYGGDGFTTLALPDLRGRTPVHAGNGPGLANRGLGSTTDSSSAEAISAASAGRGLASESETQPLDAYPMSGADGGFRPALVFNFVIALQGLFPSRN
jgi:microcystin-dependent protein